MRATSKTAFLQTKTKDYEGVDNWKILQFTTTKEKYYRCKSKVINYKSNFWYHKIEEENSNLIKR